MAYSRPCMPTTHSPARLAAKGQPQPACELGALWHRGAADVHSPPAPARQGRALVHACPHPHAPSSHAPPPPPPPPYVVLHVCTVMQPAAAGRPSAWKPSPRAERAARARHRGIAAWRGRAQIPPRCKSAAAAIAMMSCSGAHGGLPRGRRPCSHRPCVHRQSRGCRLPFPWPRPSALEPRPHFGHMLDHARSLLREPLARHLVVTPVGVRGRNAEPDAHVGLNVL